MKYFWLVSLWLLTGCATLNAPVGSNPFAAQAQPTAAPAGVMAEVATVTASPIPTTDYSSTYPGMTQAAAEQAVAFSLQQQADAKATMAEGERIIAQSVSTKLAATPTALEQARMAGTPTAEAMQRENDAKAQVAYIEQENARILAGIEADKRRAQNAETIKLAGIIAGIIIVCAIILARIALIAYRAQVVEWKRATGETSDNLLDNLPEARHGGALIPQGTNDPQVYSARRVPPPPAHIADNPKWIAAALAGESVAVDVWEKSGKYKGNYRELYRWLANNKLIVWKDRMILNDNGRKAVAPHSPNASVSPEKAPPASVPYTEGTENAGGGGEEGTK